MLNGRLLSALTLGAPVRRRIHPHRCAARLSPERGADRRRGLGARDPRDRDHR